MKLQLNEKTGKYRINAALTAEEIFSVARELSMQKLTRGQGFTSADQVKSFLSDVTIGLEKEVFGIIYLDNQNRLIEVDKDAFKGTINSAAVYPREIVKSTLNKNAAAIFIFHNHPSGCSAPSQADINITKRIKQALDLIDVRLLDHFVIGTDIVSFAERGLM